MVVVHMRHRNSPFVLPRSATCHSGTDLTQRIHRSVDPFRGPVGRRALTLVEVMFGLVIMTMFMLGFIGSYLQSRRITESSVMHAAATSMVYGIIEQMKEFDYVGLIPSTTLDGTQAANDAFPGGGKAPPYIRVRLNQDQVTWLQCKYTQSPTAPAAPTTTPASSATAASLSVPDNTIGPIALSNVAGAKSQTLTMHVWVWVDEMPDTTRDVSEVKRVTFVYSYTFNDGRQVRTTIDREVFIRTRYDQ